MVRPPGRGPRPRGGDWLHDEVVAWQQAGIDVVVSLLTPEEIVDLELTEEGRLCQGHELRYVAFPVADRGTPASRAAALELVRTLEQKLAKGERVLVHCRQGIGRSALVAACLLVAAGASPAVAFGRIAAARGCSVPETEDQRAWVARFARDWLTAAPRP